jgi:uncharacterized membrane protein
MFVVAAIVAVIVGVSTQWRYAALAGWDAGALTFVVWVAIATFPLDPAQTASHATRENPGRAVSEGILIGASLASLAAVGVVLIAANSTTGAAQDGLALFAVASVALSWLSVHLLFMLHYARLYYGDPVGGVDFNQQEPPQYLDFAYLALTLGMTYQVSDTAIRSSAVRRTALRHALLSFLFGAVILASTINLVVSLGSGKG